MTNHTGGEVVPFTGKQVSRALAESKVRESPFLDLPPGGRIEVGSGCLFISLKPNAGFPVRKNWSTWIAHLKERLVAARCPYELLKEKGDFVDGIRIYTLPVGVAVNTFHI